MNRLKLLLVPDHGMLVGDKHVQLENAEVGLINFAQQSGYITGVAAIGVKNENTSLPGILSTEHNGIANLGLLHTHRGPLSKLLNYIHAFIKIPFILREYDVIYTFFPGHICFLVSFWAILLKRPYGLYVRCNWLKNGTTPGYCKLVLRGSNFIIATGQSFHEKLKSYTHRIVTEVPLTPMRPIDEIPERPAPSFYSRLIFVGRICESKGVLDIVRALPVVKKTFSNVRLIVAGGGTSQEKLCLENLAEELNVRDHLELRGHLDLDQLRTLYTHADLLVFPSYYREGFPRVINEAMMYGLPVITCPMPGAEGFLVDNVHCLYCEPRNPIELADKIVELLNNPQKSKDMGIANFQTIHKLYASFECNSHPEQLVRFLEGVRPTNQETPVSMGVK